MARTKLSAQRLVETKRMHIGRIIIFCEGYTERNYMDYFANIINNNGDRYTDIRVELEVAGGNAQRVLNSANEFLFDEANNKKYSLYKKYLTFDCDSPQNIQSVIWNAAKSKNEYELLISNYLFETWLLMHYENVNESLTKSKTYRKLEEHLKLEQKTYSKQKNSRGIIRKIITNTNVENAIKYASELDKKYITQGKTIYTSVEVMRPYSNVYKLIEQFMLEISD